jgi:hypothetical protein
MHKKSGADGDAILGLIVVAKLVNRNNCLDWIRRFG